ncbi:MAG: hypothetical protein LC122_02505 [Chitinophagales bacterium]|nr:hypothetical protein [Chitinophagales bacterium]
MAKMNLLETLKSDAQEAAWQTAAETAAKVVQKTVVSIANNKAGPDGGALVASIIDTPAGLALIQLIAGIAVTQIPGVSDDPRAAKLGTKLRQNGMAGGMGLVADEVLTNLIPSLTEVVNALPPAEESRVRVEAPKVEEKQLTTDDEAIESVEKAQGKRRAQV